MSRQSSFFLYAIFFLIAQSISAQPKRIAFNNQQIFLSGANIAWVNFASDLGPGITDINQFADILLQVHNHGGNAVRWWLHTNGVNTPQFKNDSVIGPGPVCIADMKKVLDLAWERKVGVILCLWSFDMMNNSNGTAVLNRNKLLLSDTNYTRKYINNSLVPMVETLKQHPAIIAWEIFNEPEGMASEFGFGSQQYVPMSTIQRFVNLCAGAIHRADDSALVTNGAWSFYSLSDNVLAKTSSDFAKLSQLERYQAGIDLKQRYRSPLTPDEIINRFEKISQNAGVRLNYYRDDRLIGAGGDTKGVLDFYSVHYYSSSTPISTSPFNANAVTWGLNKPIVVAEYAMESGHGAPQGIAQTALYDTLYHLGYAGSLPWSWTDVQFSNQAHMLAGMQSMWDNHRSDVAVNGIVNDWPAIAITSPLTNVSYPDSTNLSFHVTVKDTLPIASIVFYADTTKIGSVATPYAVSFDTSFYRFRWTNILPGSYSLTAIATNKAGHQSTSNTVILSIGKPVMTRLEAETAALGSGMTVKSDPSASGGKYVDVAAQDSNTVKITWYFSNVAPSGNYEIAFGYKLAYNTPKIQYINVNGKRIGELSFDGVSTTTWYEKSMTVPLVQGSNNIQMQMFWGWMFVDYLAVPRTVLTSVSDETIVPTHYSLEQNFPNPFNPSTTINISLPKASIVRLTIYNILGQKIATLADTYREAGSHQFTFDAAQCASGVYFYRLEAGTFISQKKMLLLR
jgi:hypothetical protein